MHDMVQPPSEDGRQDSENLNNGGRRDSRANKSLDPQTRATCGVYDETSQDQHQIRLTCEVSTGKLRGWLKADGVSDCRLVWSGQIDAKNLELHPVEFSAS